MTKIPNRGLKRQEIKKALAVERKVVTATVVDETETRSSPKTVFCSLKIYVPGTRRNDAVHTGSNF